MAKSKKKNVDWARVHGPDNDVNKADRTKANKSVFETEVFKKACEAAGIDPTIRQASKFRRKRGIAFNHGK